MIAMSQGWRDQRTSNTPAVSEHYHPDMSKRGDGMLRCNDCRGRFPAHLMRRAVYDTRNRERTWGTTFWRCQRCFERKFGA